MVCEDKLEKKVAKVIYSLKMKKEKEKDPLDFSLIPYHSQLTYLSRAKNFLQIYRILRSQHNSKEAS